MPATTKTLLRQWHMLRCIPRYPKKITALELLKRLEEAGYKIHKRSVERDLKDLSGTFPLVLDDRSKPYGWSWQQDAPSFDLPGLDNNEALMLVLAKQHLESLLPTSVLDVLTPYFSTAQRQLSEHGSAHRFRNWADKVRTVLPMQPLIPPKVGHDVQRAVSEALLQEKQLEIAYRYRDGNTNHYRIHPLALVQRGAITYLSVCINEHQDVRTIALHRIVSAEVLDVPIHYPNDFDVDRRIDSGHFGFGQGEQISLTAAFRNGYGDHLHETPLSEDQTIQAQPDGSLLVTATVSDTLQLEWWLLGLGDGVEVLAPATLRSRVADILRKAFASYDSN